MKKFTLLCAAFAAAISLNAAQLANPVGTDGRYIVKWDCEAGDFAESNDFEPGETVTIAFDITGTPWEAAIAAAPDGVTFGLAAHIWTNDDNTKPKPAAADMDAAAERLVKLADGIYGATYNLARAFGKGAIVENYTRTDEVMYVYGILHVFGFTMVGDKMEDAGWYANDEWVDFAEGADCVFATLPSTGRLDAAFNNKDFAYPYTNHLDVANYAAPCVMEGATAMEVVKDVKAAQKMIENGRLILVKDGVRFNALGARF